MNSLVQSPGQNHNRIGAAQALLTSKMTRATSTRRGESGSDNGVVEITTTQKMVSAMSGSLFTSLLVTPLDVVRVRWQVQGVPQSQPKANFKPPNIDFQKIAVDTTNAFRPANLGVTACCREVFFINNNAESCFVGPKLEGLEHMPTNSGNNVAECMVEQTQKKTFNSTFDGMKKIARNEGFTALWRGLSPTLLMAIPANIIYFTGYDWLRYNPQSPITRVARDEYAPLIAGSFARMLAATAVSPIELFRTRLQATTGVSAAGHLLETFRSVEDMVKQQGYRSLWRGLTLTLWRDVPFSGIYWWGYESIRNKLTDAREKHRSGSLELDGSRTRARRRSQSEESHAETFTDSFTAGAISGAVASIVTMPFDVGKTRTQVYRNASVPVTVAVEPESALAPEERSMVRLLWHIFKTEGAAGLWKGWVPRTLKVAPACAIMISSYEVGKRVFRSINERAAAKEEGGD